MKIQQAPISEVILVEGDVPEADISAALFEAVLEIRDDGHPVQIFSCATEDQPPRFDMSAIDSILDKVGSRPVAIVSVNGLERVGKSTLLNVCLHHHLLAGSTGELQDIPLELPGFKWRSGCISATAGMAMWSEPFLVGEEGSEIAVLLLDTQGSKSPTKKNQSNDAIMCCLSMWMSSVYICNVLGNHAADLVRLPDEFAEFAVRFCSNLKIDEPPFQNVIFLGRDWRHYGNYPYGLHRAADRHKDDDGLENAPQEKNVIHHLKAAGSEHQYQSFTAINHHWSDVSAFLLPTPSAAISSNYDGKFCLDGDALFGSHLSALVRFLFHDSYLRPRRLYGKELTGHDLRHIVRGWAELLEAPEGLTGLRAISEVTVEHHLTTAEDAAEKLYDEFMLDVAAHGLCEKEFQKKNDDCCREVMERFGKETARFGDIAKRMAIRQKLDAHIQSQHAVYRKMNTSLQVELQLRQRVDLLSKKLSDSCQQQQKLSMKVKTQRLKIARLKDENKLIESFCQSLQEKVAKYKNRRLTAEDREISSDNDVESDEEMVETCPCQKDQSTCCCRGNDDSKVLE